MGGRLSAFSFAQSGARTVTSEVMSHVVRAHAVLRKAEH